jgi:hypothetical protein
MPATVEIVVARCGEDVAWVDALRAHGFRVTVYDKTPAARGGALAGAVPLANVGREADTWLHHLVERYETLTDVTIFLQGDPFPHFAPHLRHAATLPAALAALAALAHGVAGKKGVPALVDAYTEPHGCHGLPAVAHLRRLGLVREADLPPGARVHFAAGAQYAVPAAALRARPVELYRRLRDMVRASAVTTVPSCGTPYLEDAVDPWTIERMWLYIFSPAA